MMRAGMQQRQRRKHRRRWRWRREGRSPRFTSLERTRRRAIRNRPPAPQTNTNTARLPPAPVAPPSSLPCPSGGFDSVPFVLDADVAGARVFSPPLLPVYCPASSFVTAHAPARPEAWAEPIPEPAMAVTMVVGCWSATADGNEFVTVSVDVVVVGAVGVKALRMDMLAVRTTGDKAPTSPNPMTAVTWRRICREVPVRYGRAVALVKCHGHCQLIREPSGRNMDKSTPIACFCSSIDRTTTEINPERIDVECKETSSGRPTRHHVHFYLTTDLDVCKLRQAQTHSCALPCLQCLRVEGVVQCSLAAQQVYPPAQIKAKHIGHQASLRVRLRFEQTCCQPRVETPRDGG